MIANDRFLNYAKRILSRKSAPEEELRTAISRAYYSLFHETGNRLRMRYSHALIKCIKRRRRLTPNQRHLVNRLDPKFIRKFNLHKIYSETLIDLGFKGLAISFKQSRINRNKADYDLQLNFSHSNSSTIVNSIDILISLIRSA